MGRRKEDFTNGELGIMLTEQGVHILEIKEQTTKTNGSVRSLQLSRAYLWGAVGAIGFLLPIMWYLITITLNSYQEKVDTKINQAIIQYDKNNFTQ